MGKCKTVLYSCIPLATTITRNTKVQLVLLVVAVDFKCMFVLIVCSFKRMRQFQQPAYKHHTLVLFPSKKQPFPSPWQF